MTDRKQTKQANCADFRDALYHFQADELPEAQRRTLQGHLNGCPDCARRLEVEDGMLQGLRKRLGIASAPPGLETRVRAALEEARPAASKVPWYRAPWLVAAAASLLLALLILPGVGLGRGLSDSPATQVARTVTVVDLDCDRAGRNVHQQRKCRHPRHVNVLKVGGSYWNVSMDTDVARNLVLDPKMRGHRLRVAGAYYPNLKTLQLRESADLGLTEL